MEGTINEYFEIIHRCQNLEIDKMKEEGESMEGLKKKLILFSEIRLIIQVHFQIKNQINAV